jgi:hypothetical protein
MEFKEDSVIPLRVWQDEMMGVSFVDVLGTTDIYSIKIPSTIDKYKHGHLINPMYLLDIELVKTRKNWVLKNISVREQLAHPHSYEEHIKLAEMIKTLIKLSYTDQVSDLQQLVIRFLTAPLNSISLSDFEAAILDTEGFLNDHHHTTMQERVTSTKNINNLE